MRWSANGIASLTQTLSFVCKIRDPIAVFPSYLRKKSLHLHIFAPLNRQLRWIASFQANNTSEFVLGAHLRVIPEPSLLYPLPCRLCTLYFKCRSSLEKHVFIAFDSATDKLILQHESFIYQMNSWTYVAAVKASKKSWWVRSQMISIYSLVDTLSVVVCCSYRTCNIAGFEKYP